MTLKPHICGKNRIQMPTSGCSCDSLTTAEIDAVTPMECYKGECDESELGTLLASGTSTAEDALD